MENVNICEAVLDKKLEGYSFETKNFVAGSEITVTITLAEYRNLVANDARFLRMKETHPKQYEYIMKPVEEGGLNYREILTWINEHGGFDIKF